MDACIRFDYQCESRKFPDSRDEYDSPTTKYPYTGRGGQEERLIPEWRLPRLLAQFGPDGRTSSNLTPELNPLAKAFMLKYGKVRISDIAATGDNGLHMWRRL